MGISLSIRWDDGRVEFPCGIGTSSGFEWARIARQLQLPMLTHFDGGLVPFDRSNLSVLVREFERLRAHFVADEVARGVTAKGRWSDSVEQFISEINRLRDRTGWTANLG